MATVVFSFAHAEVLLMDDYDANRQLIREKVFTAVDLEDRLIEFQGGEELRCYVCGCEMPYSVDIDLIVQIEARMRRTGLRNPTFSEPYGIGLRLARDVHYGSHGLMAKETWNGQSATLRMAW